MGSTDEERPAQILAELDRLRGRTRTRAHGGAWLPALAVAVLLLASTVLYRTPFGQRLSISTDHPYWAGLPDEQRNPVLSYAFWFVGIPLLFAATGAWYAWRARRVGLRVSWPLAAGAGLGALVLLAILAAVPETAIERPFELAPGPVSIAQLGSDAVAPPPDWYWPGLLTPLLPVAVAVLALAWTERSTGLAVAGIWIGLLTTWLCCTRPLGYLPPWATNILGGQSGSLGGQLALRPGHYLVLMALPLVVFAAVRAARTRRLPDA